jgi:hypothetical protein
MHAHHHGTEQRSVACCASSCQDPGGGYTKKSFLDKKPAWSPNGLGHERPHAEFGETSLSLVN